MSALADFQNYDGDRLVIEEFVPFLERVNVNSLTDDADLRKAFQVTINAVIKLADENNAIMDAFKDENDKNNRHEQEAKEEIEYLKRQLIKYQQDPNLYTIDNQIKAEELERDLEDLRKENDTLQYKFDNEKAETERLRSRNEEMDRLLKNNRDEIVRLKDLLRDYENRRKNQLIDQDDRNKNDLNRNLDKIRRLTKRIGELTSELEKSNEENERLEKIIENSKSQLKHTTVDMDNIRKDMDALNELKMKKDYEIKELTEQNYKLKHDIDVLNSRLLTVQNQDAMISEARDRLIQQQSMLQEKDKTIEQLKSGDKFKKTDGQMLRMQMQLNNALADLKKKDKEIERMKKDYEEFTREMDKNAAVIDNYKKTIQENSKTLSVNNQFNIAKQFEQKVTFYENRVKESETRIQELEQQAAVKEKELIEALTRMRQYESGDYQLQQAIAEIKDLKKEIKVRDRDIQNLVDKLNKLDVQLSEMTEENEDYRAKLGLAPKEKLNLDELNNLRAIRAQENRVQIYVLQRENEELLEKQNQLRGQIIKLAKQVRSKEVVSRILEEDDDFDFYDLIESKIDRPNKKGAAVGGKTPASGTGEADPRVLKENELMKRRNEHLLQILMEFENENKLMEKGLLEIDDQIKKLNAANLKGSKGARFVKDNVIKCPSLEKLLSEIEAHRTMRSNMKAYSFLNKILLEGGGADAITLALKSEIDFLSGRNEELRATILQQKNEINNSHKNLTRLQDEVDKLKTDVRFMNFNSAAKDIFHPFKLPEGIAPSSQDIISALNEYLIDTLQELDEYKKLGAMAEKELETLKRKYAVARHQVSLLYKDYIEESKSWAEEKEALNQFIKKQNDTIAIDSVKLQEYDRLLEVLQKDEPEIRKTIAENSRQMHLIRENEKKLQRKCLAHEEANSSLIKDNKKLKVELIEMEIAIQQRIGYLERYKDLAHFRITSLQKQLEESVPISKLETVNKEYDHVVHNYRQLLDKQEKNDELTASLHQTEQLNKKFENEIEFLRRELENQKDKANIFEETLNRMRLLSTIPPVYVGGVSVSGGGGGGGDHHGGGGGLAASLEHDNSVISMAKRLTALEMKELNERQKADHAQRMYDQQRNLMRELENRNIELEANFTQLSKKYLALEKSESELREQLTQFVPKSISDQDKARIKEYERKEMLLKLEVSRLRELTEITLYQNSSIEFINNVTRTQMESFGMIDIQSSSDETDKYGRLHRQLILVQISEATAVRKLQHSQAKCKKLEAQLIRTEQKYDRDNQEFYIAKREYISKISYLRSTVQDLRHKYAGSIPLRQQERFANAKIQVADMKKELTDKLNAVNDQKYELEDKLAECELKIKEIEALQSATVVAKDGSGIVKIDKKFFDSFKRNESSIKMINLKLERVNRRLKDENRFLAEMNRKHEIAIIALEEENLRMENDFDAKLLIWEHREADLERSIEHLRKQHQAIESLAISFEEISGHMPDPSLPIANQLDQAFDIIRSHIKLLAEAKVQTDLSKKRIDDLETKARKLETELNIRDKVIAELRLRLPATEERDLIIKGAMNSGAGDIGVNNAPVKAAQATIESLQNRLRQKDETIVKYQDMLKLARDEITNMNKQHEIEINNLIDKNNLMRETNIERLKNDMRSPHGGREFMTHGELNKLQELQEVTIDQENTINQLNRKIKQLNTEIDTWKARHELLSQQSAQDLAKVRNEELEKFNRLQEQMSELRGNIADKESEIRQANEELERQRQEMGKSPSLEMKSLVEKLKSQLNEKEEQQRKLTQALNELKGDMVEMAKNDLTALSEESSQERRIRDIVEKTSAEYQDKIMRINEEMLDVKKQLKQSEKTNDELKLELDYVKTQLKTKEAKLKKLGDENKKLTDPTSKHYSSGGGQQSLTVESKPTEVDGLRRQIRILEEKLRKQRQSVAEKPYSEMGDRSRSKSPKNVDDQMSDAPSSLKYQLEQYKTRYNYVLSENAILKREKYDLEVEIERLKRDVNLNGAKVFQENKELRDELSRLRSRGGGGGGAAGGPKTRGYSPGSRSPDLRAENKNQLLLELKKLTEENTRLREKAAKVDALQRNVDLLRIQNDRYENDDAQSSGSASSVKRIGESGKSAKELEKTIALMKKIIQKLQTENESLKKNT